MSRDWQATALQGPRLAIWLLSIIVAGGTLGYVLIEGWSVWDGLYMAVTTVATVGFREVHPLSPVGEAFTLLLIVCGVGTAFYSATLLATHVVEASPARFVERRRKACFENLRITSLCGYGSIGAHARVKHRTAVCRRRTDPERVSRL